jgi:hypothetical protein
VNVEEQWAAATSQYEAALGEFRAATGAIIDRLKASQPVTEADWQREQDARTQLLEARELVTRLDRIRKLAAGL